MSDTSRLLLWMRRAAADTSTLHDVLMPDYWYVTEEAKWSVVIFPWAMENPC